MSLADINKIYFSNMIFLPRQKHFSTAVRLNASLNIACTSRLARLCFTWLCEYEWTIPLCINKHTAFETDGPFYSLPSKLLPLPISFFNSYSCLFQLAFRSFLQFLLFIQCIIFQAYRDVHKLKTAIRWSVSAKTFIYSLFKQVLFL